MTTVKFEAAFLVAPRKGKTPAKAEPPISIHADRKARRLALAYRVEQLIESGELRDLADAARRLGLTRARLTQIQDLLLMPLEEQERLLMPEGDA